MHCNHGAVPHLDVVVGSTWSYDPESYASTSIATGRVSHAGKVKGDGSRQKGIPWSSWLGVGHAVDNSTP
jgi:hypothetical protein